MRTFSNMYTNDLTTMITVNHNKILTGSKTGEIRLWTLTEKVDTYYLECNQLFSGHSATICYLALLPNGRFVSSSADGTMRIWSIALGNCEIILRGGYVDPASCDSIVALPDHLMAVAGYCSPAWECFDVWDTQTGKCLFSQHGMLHRPHGISLAMTTKGYLAVHGHCSGKLSTWKVSRIACAQVSECEDERIYSMAALPSGGVITGGFSLNIFTHSDDGIIQSSKTIANSNVIDTIIPLEADNVLTIDRQNACAGTVKLWNCLSEEYEVLDNSHTPSGEVMGLHAALGKSGLILSIGTGEIGIQRFPTIFQFPKDLAEIRKNSRVLAQAYRTKTGFFATLPIELNIKIAALTGNSGNVQLSEKVAIDHFRKPRSF